MVSNFSKYMKKELNSNVIISLECFDVDLNMTCGRFPIFPILLMWLIVAYAYIYYCGKYTTTSILVLFVISARSNVISTCHFQCSQPTTSRAQRNIFLSQRYIPSVDLIHQQKHSHHFIKLPRGSKNHTTFDVSYTTILLNSNF